MWWLNTIWCILFLQTTVSHYIPHRLPDHHITNYMINLHDTIVTELDFTKTTDLYNFTCHINEFNQYVRNLVSSFYDKDFIQYRREADAIYKAIKEPKWIACKDFSALQKKYEWDEFGLRFVNRVVKKTVSLWERFQNLIAKNLPIDESTEEFYG